jgi:hypothetical protein
MLDNKMLVSSAKIMGKGKDLQYHNPQDHNLNKKEASMIKWIHETFMCLTISLPNSHFLTTFL